MGVYWRLLHVTVFIHMTSSKVLSALAIQNFPLYSISKRWKMILDPDAKLKGIQVDEPLGQGHQVRSKPFHYGEIVLGSFTEVCWHVDCPIYYWRLIFLTSSEAVFILLCYALHLLKGLSSQPSIMCYMNTWLEWYSTLC